MFCKNMMALTSFLFQARTASKANGFNFSNFSNFSNFFNFSNFSNFFNNFLNPLHIYPISILFHCLLQSVSVLYIYTEKSAKFVVLR